MKKIALIGIDWQYDFVSPKGALSVPGAEDDAKRTAGLIKRLGKKITSCYFSLDSHQYNQIFHPSWWLNKQNQHPNPFTPISHQEVVDGVWRATKRHLQDWSLQYTKALEDRGRYSLFVWPNHCIIGTKGWSLNEDIQDALRQWELDNFRRVSFIVKGNNPYVENYSIFQAEVQRPDDPATQLSTTIIQAIEEHDEIVLTGEAGSHCLAWSVTDLADNFSNNEYIEKLILLKNATSPVPGFEDKQEEFINTMAKRGMRVCTTEDYLV